MTHLGSGQIGVHLGEILRRDVSTAPGFVRSEYDLPGRLIARIGAEGGTDKYVRVDEGADHLGGTLPLTHLSPLIQPVFVPLDRPDSARRPPALARRPAESLSGARECSRLAGFR